MCAHAENLSQCPICEVPTSFTREQVAFLEDILINRGCMRALEHSKESREPEKCRECAINLARIVDLIREMHRR